MESKLGEISAAFSNQYSGWILWNLFLAFVPMVLSFWLFRRRKGSRSGIWWLVFAIYIAFLPNAPYLLTDIIHLIRAVRHGFSIIAIALAFIPLHIVAILAGFETYVVSLLNQGEYLRKQGARQYILWTELLTHALCSLGVFMGRFRRYNSWDLVLDPNIIVEQTLDDLTSKRSLLVIAVTFVVITVLYWLMKQITLGLVLRWRYARVGKEIEL
ncbi:MAG TPA: DUF1361 domain-containing protein [Trichocoleus sp.]